MSSALISSPMQTVSALLVAALFAFSAFAAEVGETEPNDLLAEASPLTTTADALTPGLVWAQGHGNLESSSANDYWSFTALANDRVSIEVHAVNYSWNPRVRLYNAAGGNSLAYDDNDGPNSDAFILRYTLSASGTYYVQAYAASGSDDY